MWSCLSVSTGRHTSGGVVVWLLVPGSASGFAAGRRRLEAKPAICRSVYNKVHPNANRIRGKDLSQSEKETRHVGEWAK